MKNHKALFSWLVALLGPVGSASLSAQAPSASEPPGASESAPAASTGPGESNPAEIVKMSQFEVTTTQGHGYVSTNAATGFKTNESLMDIPQVDVVVTNDFITDLGYENTNDVLQYFGVSSLFQGENDLSRGYRLGYPYVDEMPQNAPYQDNAYVDSYEVIKGPTEVLYLNTFLSGVVLKATKKPLPFEQNIFSVRVDQNGLFRAMVDSSGPLGQIGDVKLGYRFVGVAQRGDTYFYNLKDNRTVLFPEAQITYHNTSVRLYYNYEDITTFSGLSLLTPGGKLYTGAGRKEGNMPPDNMDHYQQNEIELEVLDKISETWENRLMASHWRLSNLGPIVIPAQGYDWGTQTEYWGTRYDGQFWDYWTVLDDTSGHYSLGPSSWEMKCVDAFGFSFASTKIESYTKTLAVPFGNKPLLPGQPAGTLAVPMNSVAAINSIVVPRDDAYGSSPNEGNVQQSFLSAIYFQHAMDVIPNWLTLSAAFTWDNIRAESVTNISTQPWTPAVVPAYAYIHRLGAILHLTSAISLYALDSTSFTPPGGTALLENGQLPPVNQGLGSELGLKANFLGGRLSGEFAWFKFTTTNVLNNVAGIFPNGQTFGAVIGSAVQEGVDGDVSFILAPGWQLIGSFYAGHDRDINGVPVTGSYDNQWAFFTRYSFDKREALSGLAIGVGVSKIGGRWLASSGLLDAPGLLPPSIAGETPEIKLVSRPLLNGFVSYGLDKHWVFRVNAYNLLDEVYAVGLQHAYELDPSSPTTFSFEAEYRF